MIAAGQGTVINITRSVTAFFKDIMQSRVVQTFIMNAAFRKGVLLGNEAVRTLPVPAVAENMVARLAPEVPAIKQIMIARA